MKKVLIIDDENRTRDLIAKMIQTFGLDVSVISEGETVESAIKAIEHHQPNIVFIDIQMPDGTGFDVLKNCSTKAFEVIFITAHEEFAIQAIKFSALDYLLKPVDPLELKAALEKAIQNVNLKKIDSQLEALQNNILPNQKKRLVLKTMESIYIVELHDIIRCESDKNYTSFFLQNGKKIIVSKTLKEYETLLQGHSFMRVQQSHLININFVERFDKGNGGFVIMKDKSEIPLSTSKRDAFFETLENLM